MRPELRRRLAAAAFAVLLVLHVGAAWRSRFVIDDAYISFRYARNLVRGLGLVFNPGERVEGYSNLLWVLLLSGAMRAGIAPEPAAQIGGLLSSAALLAVVWWGGRRAFAGLAGRELLALAPVALLALQRSMVAWATSGLETRWATLLVVLAVVRLAEELRAGPAAIPWSAVPAGLALLTRPDAPVTVGGAMLAALLVRRGRPGRHGLWLVGALAVVVAALTAFRLAYYDAWLPNTVQAKVTGLELAMGARYLGAAAAAYGLWLLLPLAAWGAWRARDPLPTLALGGAATQLAYLLAIGGDHFEFRLLDPVWPLLALAAVAGLASLGEGSMRRRLVALGLGAACLAWSMVPSFTGFRDGPEMFSVETEAGLCALWTRIGAWFAEHAAPDDVIAVRPAGVIPYVSDLRTLDMHGLNDRVVARRPPETWARIAGHKKFATWEDILVRARTNYVIGHPVLQADPPPVDDQAMVVPVGGRRFALVPTWVRLGDLWFRFEIVSAWSGGPIDAGRVRSRLFERPRARSGGRPADRAVSSSIFR